MFTEKFLQILQERNIKPYHISKSTGISAGLMSEYASGKKKPTLQNIEKIADYLNVSVDYLLGREKSYQHQSITQSNVNGDNSAHIESSQIADMERQLLELFNQLSIVQKAEIIMKMNEMVQK